MLFPLPPSCTSAPIPSPSPSQEDSHFPPIGSQEVETLVGVYRAIEENIFN